MKKYEKHGVTDQKMRDRAENLKERSYEDSCGTCEQDWQERVTGKRSFTSDVDVYAAEGIFNEVLDYITCRCRDIESDYCSPRLFSARHKLILVLTQNFGFTYFAYRWNGASNDPNDFDAFDESVEEDCVEPAASNKERVVKALKDYLTFGAAKAKSVGSDAYLLWREALMDCVFRHHNFGAGAEQKDVESLLEKIEKAARITWADMQIDHQMKLLTAPTENPKRAFKKTKNK